MKKVLLSLALLMASIGAWSQDLDWTWAETVTLGEKITDVSTIADEQLVVFKHVAQGKYLSIHPTTNQIRLERTELTGLSVFKLHKVADTDNQFTFESAHEGYYFPNIGRGGWPGYNVTNEGTPNPYEILSKMSNNTALSGGQFVIKSTVLYGTNADYGYFDGGQSSTNNYTGFTGWEGRDDNCKYEIYPVTVSGETAWASMPEAGKYYYIKGQNATKPYLSSTTASDNNLQVVATKEEAAIYYVEAIEGQSKQAYLKNLETNKYFIQNGAFTLGDNRQAVTFTLGVDEGQFRIRIGSTYMFNNDTDGKVHQSGLPDAVPEKFFTFEEVAMPKTGKFYRIKGQDATKPYVGKELLGAKNSVSVVATADEAGIYYLQNVSIDDNKGKLINFDTSKYMYQGDVTSLSITGNTNKSDVVFYAASDNQFKYELQVGSRYVFNNTTSDGYLHEGGRGAASEKFFTFEEVETLPVTIGATGYATFFAPVAVALPEGLKAYYVQSTTETSATMTEIEARVVPANTGVILSGSADTKYILTITTDAAEISDNKLSGSVGQTYVEGEGFVLAAKDNIAGFYKATLNKTANGATGETHFLNNAFKAYLPASAVNVASARLLFDFGTETAIETIESAEGANAVIYDLAGRRVQSAQKGLYIVNGKKVIK